jgi:hypothetical protein
MAEKAQDEGLREPSPTSLQAVAKIDPNAPSAEVSSKKQSLSDIFTIVWLLIPTSELPLTMIYIVLLWLCSDLRWLSE